MHIVQVRNKIVSQSKHWFETVFCIGFSKQEFGPSRSIIKIPSPCESWEPLPLLSSWFMDDPQAQGSVINAACALRVKKIEA